MVKRKEDEENKSWINNRLPGFDPEYYLDKYKDVRDTGEDPYNHYIQYGWKEGRDPSAGFSTSGYLRVNPDVAKSGKNPLLHYINYGIAEGRRVPIANPRSPKRGDKQEPPSGKAPITLTEQEAEALRLVLAKLAPKS